MVAALLIFLLLSVLSDPPWAGRAIAVFLVVYCIFASITETGLGAPSPYLLDLVVAASLLGRGIRYGVATMRVTGGLRAARARVDEGTAP